MKPVLGIQHSRAVLVFVVLLQSACAQTSDIAPPKPSTTAVCTEATPGECLSQGISAVDAGAPERARELFAVGCAGRDGEACYRLAVLELKKSTQDRAAARAVLARGCEYGSGRACLAAGDHGLSSSSDGEEWYERGCKLGSLEACAVAARQLRRPELARLACESGDYPDSCADALLLETCSHDERADDARIALEEHLQRSCAPSRASDCTRLFLYSASPTARASVRSAFQRACAGPRPPRLCELAEDHSRDWVSSEPVTGCAASGPSTLVEKTAELRAAFLGCIEQHNVCEGGEFGELTISFTTDAQGKAVDARFDAPEGIPAGVDHCVLAVLDGQSFGPPTSGCEGERVTFVLNGRKRGFGPRDPISAPPPATEGTVGPGLEKAVIGRIIKASMGTVARCFDFSLGEDPTRRGMVTVQVTIGPSGGVQRAEVLSTTVRDLLMEDCMLRVLRTLQFPPPMGGGLVTITYPWIFLPAR